MLDLRMAALLMLGTALAAPAHAFDVAEVTTKELSDGSLIEYESSFCEVAVGDTVSVMLVGEGGDAANAELVAASLKPHNGATPMRSKSHGGARGAAISPVISADGEVAEIKLDAADEGWRTVHVRLELSNGDSLGVNLHASACKPLDAEEPAEGPLL
jgi:hypothetical protein